MNEEVRMIERAAGNPGGKSLAGRFGVAGQRAVPSTGRAPTRADVAMSARALALGVDVGEVRSAFGDEIAEAEQLRVELAASDFAASINRAEAEAWQESLQERIDRMGLTDSHGRPVTL